MTHGDGTGLRIALLVKQVPDVNAVKVDPATSLAVMPSERVMNSYDVYAVSEAVGISERTGGTVTVVTAGPSGATDVLLRAMATGAHAAIHLEVEDPNALDTLGLARMLAAALGERSFDLILTGQATDDVETGQVGPQVAEILGWPHVSLVTHIDVEDQLIRAHRDAEASKEVIELPLPAVLMVLSGRDAEQRYPTLRGMMAARKKPLERVKLEPADMRHRLSWSAPVALERSVTGVMLRDLDATDAAAQLATWLKEHRLA